MITSVWKKFDELVWGDGLYQYGRPGRILVGILRNLYAVTRDIISGQLTLRSMSLVYTTLLSIVPLLAFSFSVLKGLGVHKDLEARLYTLLEPLGDKGAEITDQLMRLVNNVNGSVLGGIGLAFFIYTAISMVQKVEESFNYVWYVSKARSFARRFTEYMLDLRHYRDLGGAGSVAFQVMAKVQDGQPPFYVLPRLGGFEGLRGYISSRYPDQARLFGRAEWRSREFWKGLGGAVFAGYGDVAPAFDKLTTSAHLYTYGLGLRYTLNRQQQVKIRVDMGFGNGDSGFYFSLGEAF